jgi:hypothetical protein
MDDPTYEDTRGAPCTTKTTTTRLNGVRNVSRSQDEGTTARPFLVSTLRDVLTIRLLSTRTELCRAVHAQCLGSLCSSLPFVYIITNDRASGSAISNFLALTANVSLANNLSNSPIISKLGIPILMLRFSWSQITL